MGLTKNNTLKSLWIKDFSKLNDITPIQRSTSLELLELSGGDWNSLKLNSLERLRFCSNLKYLGFSNIKVQDESLEPISELKGLQELSVSNQFPTEQYAMLSVALPLTKCDYFKSFIFLDGPIDNKDTMVIGKRKPFLNSKDDVKRLQRYDEQFKEFQSK